MSTEAQEGTAAYAAAAGDGCLRSLLTLLQHGLCPRCALRFVAVRGVQHYISHSTHAINGFADNSTPNKTPSSSLIIFEILVKFSSPLHCWLCQVQYTHGQRLQQRVCWLR